MKIVQTVFANANNKLRREKKPGHLPSRKSTVEINYE